MVLKRNINYEQQKAFTNAAWPRLTPIVGPDCAGVSPGMMLCSAAGTAGVSCASLSGALVALSLSAMVDCVLSIVVEACSEWLAAL